MNVLRMVLLLGCTVVADSCIEHPPFFIWDLRVSRNDGSKRFEQTIAHGEDEDIVTVSVNTSQMTVATDPYWQCHWDPRPEGTFRLTLPKTMIDVPMNFSVGYSFLAVRRRDAPGIQPAADLRVKGDGYPSRQPMQLGEDDMFYSSDNVSLPTKGDMVTLHYTTAEEEVMIWRPTNLPRGIYTVTYRPDKYRLAFHRVADLPETTAPATEVPTVAPSITTGTTTPTTSVPIRTPELHTSTPAVSGTTTPQTAAPVPHAVMSAAPETTATVAPTLEPDVVASTTPATTAPATIVPAEVTVLSSGAPETTTTVSPTPVPPTVMSAAPGTTTTVAPTPVPLLPENVVATAAPGTTTPTTSAPAKSPELHTSTPVVSGTTSSDTGSPTTVAPPTPVPFSASPFTRTAEPVAPETVVPTTAPETESPRSSTVDTHTRRTHETTAPALIAHAITAAPTGMPTEPAASNSSKDRGVPEWVWVCVVVILGIVATVAIVVLLYVARRHHSAQSPSARDFYELTDAVVDPEA